MKKTHWLWKCKCGNWIDEGWEAKDPSSGKNPEFCGRSCNLFEWERIGEFEKDVWMYGDVTVGRNVSIFGPCEINGSMSSVVIGDGCDIAAFTAINCADSHTRCLGLNQEIDRKPIVLEHHVFVGTHSAILGGSRIGHHSVIAAGTIVRGIDVPPWSLVSMTERGVTVLEGYYDIDPPGSIYPPGA